MRSHPDIFMSDPKETGFFINHYDKGYEWYLECFDGSGRASAIGEFTSYYLYDLKAPYRIAHTVGVLPIVVVIRDPVARALSQIKHGIRLGVCDKPKSRSLSLGYVRRAIDKYPIIVTRSMYTEGLRAYSGMFGDDMMLVFDQSDFRTNPEECLRSLWSFLGVDQSFLPNLVRKDVSVGINPRFACLERVRMATYSYLKYVRGVVPLIRKTRLPELYRRLNAGREVRFSACAEQWLWDRFADDWKAAKEYAWRRAPHRP